MSIYQGDKKGCVPCSIAYLSKKSDWESLFNACGGGDGIRPSKALEIAKSWGWFRFSFRIPVFLVRFFMRFIPVMVGVPMHRIIWAGTDPSHPIYWDGVNDEDHMVVLVGQTDVGDMQIVSWGDPEKQDVRILKRGYPIQTAYIVIK